MGGEVGVLSEIRANLDVDPQVHTLRKVEIVYRSLTSQGIRVLY